MKPPSRPLDAGKSKRPLPPDDQALDMLQSLVDSVQDYAIILLDPEGNVLTWTSAAEKLKGWRSDEIIGQHFSKFYTQEDLGQGKTEIELRAAAADGRFEDEGWRVRKDGTRFWANVVITALRDTEGEIRGFGKVTRDLSERRAAEERIKQQAQTILDMAVVPVVQIWEGILLVPLIGTLDSQRTQQLTERLLHRVMETGAPVAVIDITGVPTVDTQTAQHLIETISALRLLGAEPILTGVRPSIAQTLVHLGIDLPNVITRASLTSGLRAALGIVNLNIVRTGSDGKP